MSRLSRGLTSATVSGIRPGSSGGSLLGLIGAGGKVEVVSRIAAAVTAQIARAVMVMHEVADQGGGAPDLAVV